LDPEEWEDTDGDGVGDNSDAFPLDPEEWEDTDGDGVGDNADALPEDPTETTDTDGDGVGDEADFYPGNPSKSERSLLAPSLAIIVGLVVISSFLKWALTRSHP